MTRTTTEIGAWAEQVYFDLEQEQVRRWKDAAPGRKAIGYMPVFAPREVIHAAGALPVGVFGAGDWLEVIRGDAYYQSYLCHIPRSTVELALSERLNALDGMLFPSTCDVIRNLSGMWQMMLPDTYVRYVDVPHNFDPDVGGVFWQGELEQLARELGEVTGIEVTDERLRHSVRLFNENRRVVQELYDLRRDQPVRVPVSESYVVVRAGNVLDVEEHTALVREYIEAALREERPDLDNARVVISGAFCEQPPLGLLKTIERSGCFVVDDDTLLHMRWYTAEVNEDGPAFESLARAFIDHSIPTAVIYSPEEGRGQSLVERVRVARAEGVIFAAPSFCTPALLEQPMLAAALDEAGIAYTAFKYAENTGQFHPIREQTGTFADTMKLWSTT